MCTTMITCAAISQGARTILLTYLRVLFEYRPPEVALQATGSSSVNSDETARDRGGQKGSRDTGLQSWNHTVPQVWGAGLG